MRSQSFEAAMRGVPLSLAQHRLIQIAEIARQSRACDNLCRHWSISQFERIEDLAARLLESPPANLSGVAMDQLQLMREALGNDMARFNDVLEDVYNKPDWRVAYLCYFVPFAMMVLSELAQMAKA
jgi:hypothetical protein